MEKYLSEIRERIFEAMRENGWTVTMTADVCGVSRGEITNILNRRKNDIKLSTIVKISQGIEKPLLDMKEEENEKASVEFVIELHRSIETYLRKDGVMV